MPSDTENIPYYYIRSADGFIPSKLTRNPWFPDAIAGGPIAALIGVVIEDMDFPAGLEVCRVSIDILGIVPRVTLTPKITAVRVGRQVQMHRIELLANDKIVTQAHVLLARQLDTPEHPVPFPYPDPDDLEQDDYLPNAAMAGAIQTKGISGSTKKPGRGQTWVNMNGQVIKEETPSPFVKACLFGDFGNGVGSATNPRDWSFANIDITIQFFRKPRGEWLLIDAQTEGAGNGHAIAQSIFADRDGVYAKGSQMIFVAPAANGGLG